MTGGVVEPQGLAGQSTHSVQDVRFSPDSRLVAVALGLHRTKAGSRRIADHLSHLLVIRVGNDPRPVAQFDAENGLARLGIFDEHSLLWAPDSSVLAFQSGAGRIADIDRRSICTLPFGGGITLAGFFGSNELLAKKASGVLPFTNKATRSEYFAANRDCSTLGLQRMPGHWWIADVEARTKVLAVREFEEPGDTKVVQYDSWQVLQPWPRSRITGHLQFMDGGRILCESSRAERERKFLRFWDVKSGELVTQHPTLNGGSPAFAAINGTRVLATDERYIASLDEEYDMRHVRNQEVWDFRTGKTVAKWKVRWQKLEIPIPGPNNLRDAPYAIDISPNGKLVAEAGDGVLRIYELPD
ncbi:MAG: hypothetical protein U0Q16_05075 [Bryobacteraceae bacterium]